MEIVETFGLKRNQVNCVFMVADLIFKANRTKRTEDPQEKLIWNEQNLRKLLQQCENLELKEALKDLIMTTELEGILSSSNFRFDYIKVTDENLLDYFSLNDFLKDLEFKLPKSIMVQYEGVSICDLLKFIVDKFFIKRTYELLCIICKKKELYCLVYFQMNFIVMSGTCIDQKFSSWSAALCACIECEYLPFMFCYISSHSHLRVPYVFTQAAAYWIRKYSYYALDTNYFQNLNNESDTIEIDKDDTEYSEALKKNIDQLNEDLPKPHKVKSFFSNSSGKFSNPRTPDLVEPFEELHGSTDSQFSLLHNDVQNDLKKNQQSSPDEEFSLIDSSRGSVVSNLEETGTEYHNFDACDAGFKKIVEINIEEDSKKSMPDVINMRKISAENKTIELGMEGEPWNPERERLDLLKVTKGIAQQTIGNLLK